MLVEDLIRRIHEFEILCEKLTQQKLAGLFKSSFKGRGLVIDHLRKYEVGDNIKDIDWNVTARFRETFVKTFTQENERLVWIVIDVSKSMNRSTACQGKYEAAVVMGAALAYSAIEANDQVGVLFYSDKIEALVPPARGKVHFWRIAREMVARKGAGRGTNVACALEFLLNARAKNSVVFLLSDFVTADYHQITAVLAQQYELVVIRLADAWDGRLPALGWVRMQDSECGASHWVNTSSAGFRRRHLEAHARLQQDFEDLHANSSVRSLTVSLQDDYLERLVTFLQNKK